MKQFHGKADENLTEGSASGTREVTLPEMLDARERRAALQQELLASSHLPLISFTMNIPGPVKLLPYVTDAFEDGCSAIVEALSREGIPVVRQEMIREKTGWEAFFCVSSRPDLLKQLMAAIEDSGPVGRLYDIDIIRSDGSKVSREDLGLPARRCLLCQEAAHACSRSRRHSVQELTAEIGRILRGRYGA